MEQTRERVPWHDPAHPDEVSRVEDLLGTTLDDRTKRYLAAPSGSGEKAVARFHSVDGRYIFGAIAVPRLVREEDRVVYEEVDVLLTESGFATIRKRHPEHGSMFDPDILLETCPEREGGSTGEMFFRLMEDVAEAYEDLIAGLQDEITELEAVVGHASDDRIHKRYAGLRRDLVDARRNISPLLRALRAIDDERLDIQDRIFPRDVEVLMKDVREDFERIAEAIPMTGELLGGVRDYHASYMSQKQNDIVKALTVIASVLLVPTLIVGIYGQNLEGIPEATWSWGYSWSWMLIVGTTAIQLVVFWKLGWIGARRSKPAAGKDIGSVLDGVEEGLG